MLSILFSLLIAASNGETFTYTGATDVTGISSFEFIRMDDQGATETSIGTVGFDYSELTDDDTSNGYNVGRFIEVKLVTNLGIDDGFSYATITRFEWQFRTECDPPDADGLSATYVDRYGATQSIDIAKVTAPNNGNGFILTIELDIPSDGVEALGPFILKGCDFSACEPETWIAENIVEGEATMTPIPTENPSAQPTASPIGTCRGGQFWGDPHYIPWEATNQNYEFDYQGLGEHYSLYPCNQAHLEEWPVTIIESNKYCEWRGQPKGCLDYVRIILNTQPNNWEIKITDRLVVTITVGTDTNGKAQSDYDLEDIRQSSSDNRLSYSYTASNPFVIEYDDGAGQSGTLEMWHEHGQIATRLVDVQYNGYPRTCMKGEAYGSECGEYFCDGEFIRIQIGGAYYYASCPTCLRNLVCGIMGTYVKGDCTRGDAANPNDKCHYSWRTWDGNCFTPPQSSHIYEKFAATWRVTSVDAATSTTDVQYSGSCDSGTTLRKQSLNQVADGRSARARAADVGEYQIRYPGHCNTSDATLQQMDEACYENTFVKFDKCCREIGFCDVLHSGCTYDLCACTDDNMDGLDDCLNVIVVETMNTTCSVDAFYPTATPTNAPTATPTNFVAGLGGGTTAKDLVWIMSVFVVLFLLIAGCSYWYYRRKNSKGTSSFNEDDVEMNNNLGTTYTQD